MSDSSQMPPANRPPSPAPRVFRPFVGPAGQGNCGPAAPAAQHASRRQGQPFRPFAGGQATQSPTSEPVTVVPVAVTVAEPPSIEQAAPVMPALDSTTSDHEAWESFMDASPSVTDLPPEPALEAQPEEESPITVEVPVFIDRRPTPVYSLMALQPEPERERVEAAAIASQEMTPEPELVHEPVEAAAIASQEMTPEPVPEPVIELVHEADPLDAPSFVAPSSEPQPDSLIDEVDAAFISAGLPPGNAASQDATTAAATLEALARRLRAGEIELRPVPGASLTSDESTLATVLAALLATR